MSRSELYTRAIQRYVAEQRHAGVREMLDQLYAFEHASVSPDILRAQASSIPLEEW